MLLRHIHVVLTVDVSRVLMSLQEMLQMESHIEQLLRIQQHVFKHGSEQDSRQERVERTHALKTIRPVKQAGAHASGSVAGGLKLNRPQSWILTKTRKRETLDPRQAVMFVLQALGLAPPHK